MGRTGHVLIGFVVVFALPIASRVVGRGGVAFTMYSRSASYRLRLTTGSDGGPARPLAPTELGVFIGGSAAEVLAGTEQFRHGPFDAFLRGRLDDIARRACRLRPEARWVEVTFDERSHLDAPPVTTHRRVPCPGP